jgi:RNA polymerase sigma-70 factor, ECF subfamily
LHRNPNLLSDLKPALQKNSPPLDIASFEVLFKSNFKDLCYFAIQFVKDSDAAKDIVQEVFLGLWQKKESIDLTRHVKPYLTSAVRNRCLNYLRDNKKFIGEILETEHYLIDSDYKQHDRLIEEELRKKISISIEELPVKCREVFLLSRYQNLKYSEIAGKLNISVKTVETQMSKALHHLRIRLAEYFMVLLIVLIRYLGNK